jgi:hypothetical protein
LYVTDGVIVKLTIFGEPVLEPAKELPPEHTPVQVPEIEILVTAESSVEPVNASVPVPGLMIQLPVDMS